MIGDEILSASGQLCREVDSTVITFMIYAHNGLPLDFTVISHLVLIGPDVTLMLPRSTGPSVNPELLYDHRLEEGVDDSTSNECRSPKVFVIDHNGSTLTRGENIKRNSHLSEVTTVVDLQCVLFHEWDRGLD
jgi:hypothetical protein